MYSNLKCIITCVFFSDILLLNVRYDCLIARSICFAYSWSRNVKTFACETNANYNYQMLL